MSDFLMLQPESIRQKVLHLSLDHFAQMIDASHLRFGRELEQHLPAGSAGAGGRGALGIDHDLSKLAPPCAGHALNGRLLGAAAQAVAGVLDVRALKSVPSGVCSAAPT